MLTLNRDQVLAFVVQRHGLYGPASLAATDADVALLDGGIQDTGPDGAAWALAIRTAGADRPATAEGDLAYAWTLRGAPHAYRRRDLAEVAVATAPYSEVDAAKRIFDASKPLAAAGISTLDALRTVAAHLRDLTTDPVVKGDASAALRDLLPEPFLRDCKPCKAIHIYELPFRLAALQAGVELEAGTSPPVMRQVPGLAVDPFAHLATEADPRFDVIRNYLRSYGPASVAHVASHLDAPQAVVRANWPEDAVEVDVAGSTTTGKKARYVVEPDLDALRSAADAAPTTGWVTLLGPFDPFLQTRDRELLVPDAARRKQLWPVLGRPGAVLVDGEVVALWRPKTSGRRFSLRLEPWTAIDARTREAVAGQGERLAAFRQRTFDGIVDP